MKDDESGGHVIIGSVRNVCPMSYEGCFFLLHAYKPGSPQPRGAHPHTSYPQAYLYPLVLWLPGSAEPRPGPNAYLLPEISRDRKSKQRMPHPMNATLQLAFASTEANLGHFRSRYTFRGMATPEETSNKKHREGRYAGKSMYPSRYLMPDPDPGNRLALLRRWLRQPVFSQPAGKTAVENLLSLKCDLFLRSPPC